MSTLNSNPTPTLSPFGGCYDKFMSSATTYKKCVSYEQNMSKTFSYFL